MIKESSGASNPEGLKGKHQFNSTSAFIWSVLYSAKIWFEPQFRYRHSREKEIISKYIKENTKFRKHWEKRDAH